MIFKFCLHILVVSDSILGPLLLLLLAEFKKSFFLELVDGSSTTFGRDPCQFELVVKGVLEQFVVAFPP